MEWKNTRIAFLGGDLRLLHAANAFREAGADCVFWGLEGCGSSLPCHTAPEDAVKGSDIVVLGIPVSRDGNTLNAPFAAHPLRLSELVGLIAPAQKVAMGMAPVRFRDALAEKGCFCYDYNEDERFAIANALATAEGALAIAIKETPDTLFSSHCAIMGFGRIGKQLARLLKAVGANLTVFARRESDLAYASTLGCEALPITSISEEVGRFDLIFNTVPMRLQGFPSAAVQGTVIDLAPVYAESEVPRIIRAPALPFKYSPRSSGRLICDCILHRFALESEGAP